ncbi:MAG: thermonuclease family protein [Candidatus Saccharibacteria bacterium]|nr:thermonuclease family protein [Candidatus Saccharibacteria bacterium]
MARFLTRRRQRKLIVLVIGLVVAYAQQAGWLHRFQTATEANQPGLYQVVDFSDGDTVTVDMNGTDETIRFIGVDTPEVHDPRKTVQCFGKAASNFTRSLIGSNRIRLEADPLNTNRDRYNRLLRYVYLPDGQLVNAEIIKQGYGFAYLGFPFSKSDEFAALEREAREQSRGLWRDCTPTVNEFGGYTSDNAN